MLNSDKVKNIRNTTDLKNVILDLANSNTYDVKKIFVKWAKPIVLNCTMKPRQMSGYNLTWYDTRANQFLPLDQKWFDNSKYGISADNIVNPYIWNDINKNKNLTNSDPDVDFDAGINAGLNEDANSIVADSHYFYKSNNNNVHYETIFKFLAEPQIDILCPVEETSGEYSATAYAKGKHQSTDKPGIGFLEAPYYPGYSNTD